MTVNNYDSMSLDELRRYVLTNREDVDAFHQYIDRSKAAGRMISVDLNDSLWEENLTARIQQMTTAERESDQP
ncbi:MAG TPA: hypothetical protein VK211_24235 [Kamptonema sp.]|nr:hypothetical protein [Kamptonema sp.]